MTIDSPAPIRNTQFPKSRKRSTAIIAVAAFSVTPKYSHPFASAAKARPAIVSQPSSWPDPARCLRETPASSTPIPQTQSTTSGRSAST